MDDLLKQLLVSNEYAATHIVCGELNQYYEHATHKDGCYHYFVGTVPICLVAHVDTVPIESVLVRMERNIVTNVHKSPLGADDRAGCYAVCAIVSALAQAQQPLPSILITHGEETGGTGVKAFLADDIWQGHDRMFIELDRANANDYVSYYGLLPVEVEDYVESFGYVQKVGSYSDIADIAESTLVPSVNLSVGYYNQHFASESLHLDELQLTINRVVAMVAEPIAELYPLEPVLYPQWNKSAYLFSNGYESFGHSKKNGNGNGKATVAYVSDWSKCDICGAYSQTKAHDIEGYMVCEDCAGFEGICDVCEAFGTVLGTVHGDLLCEDCLERYGYDRPQLQELQIAHSSR